MSRDCANTHAFGGNDLERLLGVGVGAVEIERKKGAAIVSTKTTGNVIETLLEKLLTTRAPNLLP
ncbi:hypothetical protein IPL68_05645 [Candidatus Saccharibacteria bacterium]|nr:MAG: hypothetical protein IPL68_05645 [Candidatus Saccharibacteria bacterium]